MPQIIGDHPEVPGSTWPCAEIISTTSTSPQPHTNSSPLSPTAWKVLYMPVPDLGPASGHAYALRPTGTQGQSWGSVSTMGTSAQSHQPRPEASWQDVHLPPHSHGCPDLSQSLPPFTHLTALTRLHPQPGPRAKRGERGALLPISILVPSTPTHSPICYPLLLPRRLLVCVPSPRHLLATRAALASKLRGAAETSSRTVEGQAERKGAFFTPLTAKAWIAHSQHPIAQSSLPVTWDPGWTSTPQWDKGGHRSPITAISLKTCFLPFSAEKLTGVHRGWSQGSLGEAQSLGSL